MMKVIEADGSGGPEVLKLAQRPIPEPGAGEVLIKVHAAGVNGPDILQRQGNYPPPPGASDLIGLEIAGEVVSLGTGASGFATGDQVCALTNGGAYAEYVAVDAGHVLPVPDGVSLIDAAGLPETFFTVWSNVFHNQTVSKGANFLVHGGAGGIGSTAIQLGAAMEMEVYATSGSAEGRAFCRELGVTRAIDYKTEDFVEIVREAGGADVILDIIGGEYVARNMKAARHDARIISLAFRAGSKVELNLMPMMLKRLTLTGSTLRSRPPAFKSAVAQALKSNVWPLFKAGKLRAVTHTVLPLGDAARAHALMEAAEHRGKILLTP